MKGMRVEQLEGDVVLMNVMREEEYAYIPCLGEQTGEAHRIRIPTGFGSALVLRIESKEKRVRNGRDIARGKHASGSVPHRYS